MSTLILILEAGLSLASLFGILQAAFRNSPPDARFLTMSGTQFKCVVMGLALTTLTGWCIYKGGDMAIIGGTVFGLLAFGFICGAGMMK